MATLNVTNGTGRSKSTTSYEQYDDGRFYNTSTGAVWAGESNGAGDEVRAAQGSAINSAGVAPEVMSGYADTGLEMGLDQTKTQALSSGGAGGASKIYDSTVFAYDNVISSNVTIESPYKVATLYTSPDVTTDINDGVTVTVDDGCVLNFIDI